VRLAEWGRGLHILGMRYAILSSLALGALFSLAPDVAAQPTLPTWTLREELRLDSETHDFPGISSVAVGPNGRIALYIATDRQLRVFDASGTEVFKFGRAGSGPGEFQQVNTLRFTGDSLWAFDYSLRRISVIGPDGKLVRSQLIPAVEGLSTFNPVSIAGRTMYGRASVAEGDGPQRTRSSWHVRIKSDSSFDKLVEVPTALVTVEASTEKSFYSQVVPFSPRDVYGFSSTGEQFAIASTIATSGTASDLFVRSYRYDGRLRFQRKLSLPARPVTARQRDSALAIIEKQPTFGPELARKARPLIPATHSVHGVTIQGDDGTVLVAVRAASGDVVSLVFDASGTPRGYLATPDRTRVQVATATHLWAVQSDLDGLPSLVRYRVVR